MDAIEERLIAFLNKWGPKGRMQELADDLTVFISAATRAGEAAENECCATLIEIRCKGPGTVCLPRCTHKEDAQAIRARIPDNPLRRPR